MAAAAATTVALVADSNADSNSSSNNNNNRNTAVVSREVPAPHSGAGSQTLYEYFSEGGIASGLVADNRDFFTLNGKELTIFSGSLHYFRVHPDYWRDRLRKYRYISKLDSNSNNKNNNDPFQGRGLERHRCLRAMELAQPRERRV